MSSPKDMALVSTVIASFGQAVRQNHTYLRYVSSDGSRIHWMAASKEAGKCLVRNLNYLQANSYVGI